jgi:hypothetical protein
MISNSNGIIANAFHGNKSYYENKQTNKQTITCVNEMNTIFDDMNCQYSL